MKAGRTPGGPCADRPTAVGDWSALGDHSHAVQFYLDDNSLVDMVASLVGPAVVVGGAAIVLATPVHRLALADRLKSRGLDLAVAEAEGRYVALDAATVLRRIMRGGTIDRARFLTLISKALDGAAAAGSRRRVSVFGEAVALLWEQGNFDAAIELEELWHQLASSRAISVCCGYCLRRFSSLRDMAPFMKICSRHTHVFPAEPRATAW